MIARLPSPLRRAVAAFLLGFCIAVPAIAQEGGGDRLDTLFERLAIPDLAEWESIESDIQRAWAESGSPAMDLLLRKGREAMREDDSAAAIGHFTALTDLAPGFAEGWHARATAFFAEGLYGPALEDLPRTIALEPRHFGAYQGIGIIMRELGEDQFALEAFRKAAAIHPNQPDIKEALERQEREAGGSTL